MRRIFICLIITLILAPAVQAQKLVWQDLGGPRSSDVRSFAEAPDGDLYILVHSYHEAGFDELYRSEDDGVTWELVDAFEDALIYVVEVAPDGTLYLGSHFNIRRSTDEGATWDVKDGQFGFTYKFLFGENGLIVAPGGFNGKYTNNAYSTDNGVTWQVLPPPRTDGPFITDLAVEDRLGAIYASTYRGGIYSTTDNGASWTAVGDSLTENTWFLLMDESGLLVALADWHVLISYDGGANWDGPGGELGDVDTFAQKGDTLVAARTRDTVFASTYLGATWGTDFVTPVPGNTINELAFDADGRLYLCTQAGLYRKTVGEQEYERLFFHSGAPIQPGRIAATPSNALLISCPGNGLLRTDAMGTSWDYAPIQSPLYEPPLSFEVGETGTVYAFTRYGLYSSANDGADWSFVSGVDSMAFTRNTAILTDGTLFTANDYPSVNPGFPGGIHYRNAQNPGWPKVAFLNDTILAVAADGLDRLYFSDGNAVYRSYDGGQTIIHAKSGRYDYIYAAPDNSVYITGYNGMHVSIDGGVSWNDLPFPYPAQVVAMAKDERGHLFAALNGTVPNSNDGGIFGSYNGGATWFEENNGLSDFNGAYRCYDMVMDRTGHLIVALEDGLYRTSTPTSTERLEAPHTAALPEAYPNPASIGTAVTIAWRAATSGPVLFTVYSSLGRELQTVSLVTGRPGTRIQTVPTAGLQPGLHFYTIRTRTETLSGTFLLH